MKIHSMSNSLGAAGFVAMVVTYYAAIAWPLVTYFRAVGEQLPAARSGAPLKAAQIARPQTVSHAG